MRLFQFRVVFRLTFNRDFETLIAVIPMRYVLKSTFYVALCLSLLPFAANATVYKCDVNVGPKTGSAITDLYFVTYDADAKTLFVEDGLIQYFNKEQPMQANIFKDTEAQLAFSWRVNAKDIKNQRTQLEFNAVFYRQTNEFALSGQAHGYVNKYNARGTCALAQ